MLIILLLAITIVFVSLVKTEKIEKIEEVISDKNIYLFYGEECTYCHALMDYLSSLPDDIQNKYNLVKYEVWYDSNNAKLMQDFAEYLGEEATGVPYFVIGDKTFSGYSSQYDESIIKAIESLEENYVDIYEFVR